MKRQLIAVIVISFFLQSVGILQAQVRNNATDRMLQAPTSGLYLVPAKAEEALSIDTAVRIHDYGQAHLVALLKTAVTDGVKTIGFIPVDGVDRIQYRSWKGNYELISAISTEVITDVGLLALVGPADPTWIQQIEKFGIEILDRAPPYGLVVSASPKELAACSAVVTSYGFQVVRGWTPMPIEATISTDLMPIVAGEKGPAEIKGLRVGTSGNAYVRVFPYPNRDRTAVLDAVSQFAPRVRSSLVDGYDNVFEILGSDIPKVVEPFGGVAFVEGVYKKELHNNLAVQDYIMNVEPVWIDLGWDGTGVIVDHNDSGIDENHPDFFDGPTSIVLSTYGAMSSTDNGHGTHTAGSVAGRGGAANSPTNNSGCGDLNPPLNQIVGAAPGAMLVVNNLFDGGYGSEDLMMRWGYQNGGHLSTNSWGYGSLSTYSSYAVTVDGRVRDADTTAGGNQEFPIIFSAGNEGPGASTIGTPGNGKNTLTVGASQNDRCGAYISAYCAGPSIDLMACFSSRGPAQSRILPDVVGVGTDVISVESTDSQATYPWDETWTGSDYATSPGTSMSCPLVAGAAAVFYEFYVATFSAQPSPALLKAAMINGAVNIGTYGIPSYDQGWGLVNLRRSIEGPPGGEIKFVEQSSELSTGQSWSLPFTVGNSGTPLKITMDWTDPPGAANCSSCLVNDLDLVVTSPTGVIYKGNQFASDWAVANPAGKDDINNVECVYVQAPETGNWTMQVVSASTATNPPNMSGQDFAVVYSGSFCAALAPTGLSASPNGNNRIDLSWNAAAGSTQYQIFRSMTSGGPYTQIGTSAGTSYSDTTVSGNVTYYYVVTNFTDCESAESSETSATATGTCTQPPLFGGIVSATNGSIDNPCTIQLEWDPATLYCSGPLTYRIYRDTVSGFIPGAGNMISGAVTCSGSPCTYSDTDALTSGQPYYYVVRAYDASIGAEDSNTFEATATPTGNTPVYQQLFYDDFDSNRPANPDDYWLTGSFNGGAVEWHQPETYRSYSTTNSYCFGPGGGSSYAGGQDAGLVIGGDGTGPSGANGFEISSTGFELSFWHTYNMKSTGDGVFLMYSITGPLAGYLTVPDTVSAGEPYISTGNYTSTISDLGVESWGGDATASWSQIVVNLDGVAGETVWFLWRAYTNNNQSAEGYYLDDVILEGYEPGACTTGGSCTNPGAPSITSITDDDACAQDGVTISYTDGSGASSHDLYDNGSSVVTGFTSGSTYNPGDSASHSYVIRAIDATCFTESSASNFTDATGPGAPSITSFFDENDCFQDGIRINYSAGSGATGHSLWRDGSQVVANYTSGTLYDPGDTVSHSYVVRAINGSCTADSGSSAYTDAANMPGTPSITGITDDDSCIQSGIHVSYSAGSGASSHDLLRDGSAVVVGYVSGALYNPGGSTSYSYSIQAVSGSCIATSASQSFTDAADGPGTPSITSITDDDSCAQTGIHVNYSAGSGATSHSLWRDGSEVVANYASGALYNSGDIISHSYVVRAINGSCTADSASSSFTDTDGIPTPAAPGVSDISACDLSGVEISWVAVSGATNYDILVDGTTTLSGVTSPHTYSPGDSNAHTYQVRGRSASCNGSYSATTSGSDFNYSFSYTGIYSASNRDKCDDTGVVITWTAPASWNDGGSGSRTFTVYRGVTDVSGALLEGTTSYVDTSGVNGTSYDYSVVGTNGYNCSAGGATTIAATDVVGGEPTFAGVQSVTTMPGGVCGLSVVWNIATSNCGPGIVYNVYRSTTSGFTPDEATNMIASCVSDLYYEDTSVSGLTNYYYVVRAEDSSPGHGGPCNDGFEDTNTVEIGGILVGGNETSLQVTDPLQVTSGTATSTFAPVFTFATAAAASVSFTLSHAGGVGGTLSYDYGSVPATITKNATTTFTQTVTEVETVSSVSTTINMAPPTRSNSNLKVDLIHVGSGTTVTVYNALAVNWVDGTFGPYAGFNGLTTASDWALSMTHSAGQGGPSDGQLNAWNLAIDYAGSGDVTACTQVELIDPSSTATVIKAYGTADAVPYDVTALYTGPGTYQLRLSENCGSQAEITAATMSVDEPSCVTAASPVEHFTARSTGTNVKLEWQNPTTGYGSTLIRWDTAGYPADATSGTLLIDQVGIAGDYDTTTHSGRTNGSTYYYSVFVDDGSGEYSSRQTVVARPFDTANKVKWAYQTSATSLAPPGVFPGTAGTGAAYVVSNDRVLHGMNGTSTGGDWPRSAPFDWMPMGMNGPAQARPPIVPVTVGAASLVAFLGSLDGHIYAVNAKTGQTLWQSAQNYTMVQGSAAGIFTKFGGAYDLIFAGSRIAGSGNSMYAMDPADGTESWSFGGTIGIISSGAVVDYTNNRIYFTSRENPSGSADTLWCLSFTDASASLVWSMPYGDIDSSPVLYDGVLYVGNNSGEVIAVNPDTGAAIWSFATGDGPIKGYVNFEFQAVPRKLFLATSNKVWSLTDHGTTVSEAWQQSAASGPSVPLTLASQGMMYVGSTDGELYQIDTSDGSVVTSVLLGVANVTVGSPSYDYLNIMAYVGTEDGSVYAVTLPLQ